MYKVITNTSIDQLSEDVNVALINGYMPIGGITPVYHKDDSLLIYNLNTVDFNSEHYNQAITFMQTLYKPQTKELL